LIDSQIGLLIDSKDCLFSELGLTVRSLCWHLRRSSSLGSGELVGVRSRSVAEGKSIIWLFGGQSLLWFSQTTLPTHNYLDFVEVVGMSMEVG
jgi:hypothetical protein